MEKARLYTILGLFAGAMLSRLVPHPANWTAVGAFAIWSGFLFRDRWTAIAAPLVALLLTDLILGTHATMPWTFASCVLITLIARGLKVHASAGRLLSMSLMASVIYFFVTNFGTWYSTPFYAQTFDGLILCFELAIPFFSAQVVGDLVYVGVFSAVVYMAKISEPVTTPTKAS